MTMDVLPRTTRSTHWILQKDWKRRFISAGGYTTHPELATKIADETGYDRSTFYGGTHVGYTDYPFYEASKAE